MAVASKSKSLAKPLARVGDPYILPDGRQLQPEGTPVDVVVPKVDVRTYKPSKKRVLKELPAEPAMMNAFGCVILYTTLGLSDREIAQAINAKPEDVRSLRANPMYSEVFTTLIDEFINANSESIHSRIAAMGMECVTNVADIAMNGTKEETKLRANMDLLDRGGFSKKDRGQPSNGMDEFRIVITRSGDTKPVDLGIRIGE